MHANGSCLRAATLCLALSIASGPLLAQDAHPAPAVALAAPPSAPFDIPRPNRLSRIASGFNASLTFTGLHESDTGYATLLTADAEYNFNDTFSMDASFPVYLYRLAPSLRNNPPPGQLLVPLRGDPGDTEFGLNGEWSNRAFSYIGTFSFTAPTGDATYGLSSGHWTVDYTNHFEHTFGLFTPDIEIGIGDSNELANRSINQNYTSLGALSHFQAGFSLDLIHDSSLSIDAYEDLPIGDQKIYQSVRRGHIIINQATGVNLSEDNGFINELEIPLSDHLTLSGYYIRSLRLHTDSAAASLTYTFRVPPPDDLEHNVAALFR